MMDSTRETAQFYREQALCGVHPEYERILMEGYRRFLGSFWVCADVGVSKGLHLTEMVRLVYPFGDVVGFEPIEEMASAARLTGAMVHNVALSWETPHDTRPLYVYEDNPGETGLERRDGRVPAEVREVRVATLDTMWHGDRPLDYLKIDTEGHDLAVLLGGMGTIMANRPVISVEWSAATYGLHGHNCMSLWNWAYLAGYRIGDLWGNLVEDREEWLETCDVSYWDYFLVPKEKVDWWKGLWND